MPASVSKLVREEYATHAFAGRASFVHSKLIQLLSSDYVRLVVLVTYMIVKDHIPCMGACGETYHRCCNYYTRQSEINYARPILNELKSVFYERYSAHQKCCPYCLTITTLNRHLINPQSAVYAISHSSSDDESDGCQEYLLALFSPALYLLNSPVVRRLLKIDQYWRDGSPPAQQICTLLVQGDKPNLYNLLLLQYFLAPTTYHSPSFQKQHVEAFMSTRDASVLIRPTRQPAEIYISFLNGLNDSAHSSVASCIVTGILKKSSSGHTESFEKYDDGSELAISIDWQRNPLATVRSTPRPWASVIYAAKVQKVLEYIDRMEYTAVCVAILGIVASRRRHVWPCPCGCDAQFMTCISSSFERPEMYAKCIEELMPLLNEKMDDENSVSFCTKCFLPQLDSTVLSDSSPIHTPHTECAAIRLEIYAPSISLLTHRSVREAFGFAEDLVYNDAAALSDQLCRQWEQHPSLRLLHRILLLEHFMSPASLYTPLSPGYLTGLLDPSHTPSPDYRPTAENVDYVEQIRNAELDALVRFLHPTYVSKKWMTITMNGHSETYIQDYADA